VFNFSQEAFLNFGRSSAFFYRFTSELVAECLVPPVASVLMNHTPWIPLLIAIVFMTLAIFVALIIPETLPIEVLEHNQIISTDAPPDTESTDVESESLSEEAQKNIRWKNLIGKARQSFSFVTRDRLVAVLLLAFLILRLGRQSFHMFLQYVSTKYHWSLAQVSFSRPSVPAPLKILIPQTGFLISLRAGVNIILFTAVLPFIVTLTYFKNSVISKDLLIGRASIILMVLGTVIIGVSSTSVLMIIGNSPFSPSRPL